MEGGSHLRTVRILVADLRGVMQQPYVQNHAIAMPSAHLHHNVHHDFYAAQGAIYLLCLDVFLHQYREHPDYLDLTEKLVVT